MVPQRPVEGYQANWHVKRVPEVEEKKRHSNYLKK